MRPPDFEYELAEDVDGAVSALAQNESAMALAGGQSLIPLLRLRVVRPSQLVDIGRLPGLSGISVSGDSAELGALVTIAEVVASDDTYNSNPLWTEAAQVIADPLVRNLGTVAGNLAHADPLNDLPAAFVASRAVVRAVGPNGERTIAADDLFVSPFTTSLGLGEVITHVMIPSSPAGAYEKLKRAAVDYGVVAVAVQLDLDHDRVIRGAGVSLSGTSAVAPRMTRAEQTLVGTTGTDDVIDATALEAAEDADLASDERGSVRYKRAVIRTLAERALRRAIGRGSA